MSDNALIVEVQGYNMAEEAVLSLRGAFEPYFDKAQELAAKANEIVVTSDDQHEDMQLARDMRLELKRIRIDTDKTRKSMKEESLRTGKAIDGMANIIKYLIVPIEKHLQDQEDFAKVREAARVQAMVEVRTEILEANESDPSIYNLAEMSEEAFTELIDGIKQVRADLAKAAKRVEEEAAEKAKADAEEKEQLRKDNAALKAEVDKAAKKQADIDEKARQDCKAADAKAAEERAAELAPDKEKLEALAATIVGVAVPKVESEAAMNVVRISLDKLLGVATYIKQSAMEL